jgi:plastocyanin
MIARGSLLVLATGAFSAFAYGADVGSSTLAGKVSFSGTIAPPQKVKLAADPKCAALHPDGLELQPVRVKDGGLADALVYVKSALASSYPPPTEPVVLDQSGCEYHPRMVVVMVGQPLRIRNSDPTLHNIHPRPTVNPGFNIGQPRQGMEATRTFDTPELLIPTACEVHPWMRAYISVLPHPFFAVTKEDGSYEIRGLPDGDYEVEAVHGQLKSMTGKVTVKDGKTSKLDFTFKLVQL